MNEEYIGNVNHLIEQKDADQVKELLADLHPADIAELCNDLNPEEAKFVYRLLNNETAADVLVEMDEDARKELSLTSMIGFGVDGSNKEKQQDFEGVRGDFVINPLVTAVQEHIVNKRALGDELIERLKPLV